MSRSALETAKMLLRCRSFSKALIVLDGASEIYANNFEYHMTYGLACLYLGDFGNANTSFQKARRIRVSDERLLLCQAVLYLRLGDTSRAIQYYIDVLDMAPENKIATKAMTFIRTQGDFETICEWADSGKLARFYPPLGVNPMPIVRIAISALLGVCIAFAILHFKPGLPAGGRTDTAETTLSVDDKIHVIEVDVANGAFSYTLTEHEILKSFELARQYAEEFDKDKNVYRDNAAMVEINRILNSNASDAIKLKANNLRAMLFPKTPTFDSISENDRFSYAQVASDPLLYIGCWVVWEGRITNAEREKNSFHCDLLVGYENLKRVDGIVPLYFVEAPEPAIEGDRPVYILAQLGIENGKIVLNGSAVYQPLRK